MSRKLSIGTLSNRIKFLNETGYSCLHIDFYINIYSGRSGLYRFDMIYLLWDYFSKIKNCLTSAYRQTLEICITLFMVCEEGPQILNSVVIQRDRVILFSEYKCWLSLVFYGQLEDFFFFPTMELGETNVLVSTIHREKYLYIQGHLIYSSFIDVGHLYVHLFSQVFFFSPLVLDKLMW